MEWDSSTELWVTDVPALNQLSTYGETRQDALDQTREAILGFLEAARQEGIPLTGTEARSEVVDLEVAIA